MKPSNKAPARQKPLAKLVAWQQELARLPRDVQVPDKASKLTLQLAAQVEMLHSALLGLSDTVVQEIGGMRADVSRWRSDRDEWLTSMRGMRQEVNDKLMQVERDQARVQVEVQGAKAGMQASVSRSLEQLDARAKGLDRQLLDTRCEVQALRNAVADMQVLTADDFPAAVVRQRLQDKASIQALVEEVARDVAPAAIRSAVQLEAPSAVREHVLALVKEVVESRVEPFRRQVVGQAQEAAQAVERMSVDMAQMSGELQSLQERCKTLDTASSSSELRLSFLETQEQACPRGLAVGLSERLEVASAQQARYARSMEEVVRALVDDASQLARQAQVHDATLQQHRRHLADTREAVLRCATVYSQVLNIPPPVPIRSLASPLSYPPSPMDDPHLAVDGPSPVPGAAAAPGPGPGSLLGGVQGPPVWQPPGIHGGMSKAGNEGARLGGQGTRSAAFELPLGEGHGEDGEEESLAGLLQGMGLR